MPGELAFRPPRYGDIAAIWPRLREIEALELSATGRSPKDGLRISLRVSVMAWTVTVDGRAEGAFGVAPVSLLSGIGRPWFLGTEDLKFQRRAWLAQGRRHLAAMETAFPLLENIVHRDNILSIRWLERLGFAVDDELVHVGGHPFRRFTKGFPERV